MSKPEDDQPLPPNPFVNAPIEAAPKNKGGRPRKATMALPLSERAGAEMPKADEPVDASGLLTKAEIEALRAEAVDAVRLELKAAAKKKIKERFFKEERAKHDPREEQVQFRLELAEFTDSVIIDSVKYYHNGIYTVPRSKYDVFAEQMYRSNEHQNQIDGKSRVDLARRLYREKLPGGEISGKAA